MTYKIVETEKGKFKVIAKKGLFDIGTVVSIHPNRVTADRWIKDKNNG